VTAVNGALPAAATVARAFGEPRVEQRSRLWELARLTMPEEAPGHLRAASLDAADVALAVSWFAAFGPEAAAQAGQPEVDAAHVVEEDGVRARISDGRVHFWEVDGRPVHMTASNDPVVGVARIGPVYTPREHRGHGYAAAAVAAVARGLLGEGARVCLFTDAANPVSNRLYARLGFRPVADMASLAIGRDAESEPASPPP
jgi:predicted GNAT family acetyltransferase